VIVTKMSAALSFSDESIMLYKFLYVVFEFAEPDNGGKAEELDVYHYTGAGGVALSMFNTDEVCSILQITIMKSEV
jgi:hypothetical protein